MHRLLTEVRAPRSSGPGRSRLGPSRTVHTVPSVHLARFRSVHLAHSVSLDVLSCLSRPSTESSLLSCHRISVHLPVWHGLVSSVALMLPPSASCYMYSSRTRRYVTPPVCYSSRMLLLPYVTPPVCARMHARMLLQLRCASRPAPPPRRPPRATRSTSGAKGCAYAARSECRHRRCCTWRETSAARGPERSSWRETSAAQGPERCPERSSSHPPA